MARYRRKPIKIEAFKYSGDLFDGQGKFCVPKRAVQAFQTGRLYYAYDDMLKDEPPTNLYIKTQDNKLKVNVGDYVVRDVKGGIYPCTAEVFEATHEKI